MMSYVIIFLLGGFAGVLVLDRMKSRQLDEKHPMMVPTGKLKMVMCVNMELKMGKGKVECDDEMLLL